jgi:hypothetical protein
MKEDNISLSQNLRKVFANLPHIDSNKEKVLSIIDRNIPFSSSNYDDIIPKGDNIYITNAYIPEDSIKISKKDYKKILDLPYIDVYEDNAEDIELDKEHYEIAKRIEKFSLNVKEDELLIFTDVKERVKKIIFLIEEYESGLQK